MNGGAPRRRRLPQELSALPATQNGALKWSPHVMLSSSTCPTNIAVRIASHGRLSGAKARSVRSDTKLAELRAALEKQGQADEKALNAQEALALLRLPLRYAAEDLGHRIDNIRTRDFWNYVTEESRRREIAVLGTAYRFARWFATLEMLYDRAEFLRLEHQSAGDLEAKPVFGTLVAIGKAFASDKYDRAEPANFLSSRFMIWREEQRAMGELARDHERDGVAGFATFAARASGSDAKWVANFIEDLAAGDAPTSERLKLIQSLLAQLVRQLDPDKSYLVANDRGQTTEPNWMRPARPIPQRA